jgi:L-threonylcarbamoyladenylate synthase
VARVTLAEAADVLRAGGVVGLPTETVYGLAANALDPAAVREVFRLKGRPAGHPLILHARDPRPYACFDARAERLAAFWPAPLTLVLPARGGVAAEVGGGHATLALRCPDHPVALALLDAVGFPLAAPSANRFGGVSPTTAAHVLASFPELPVLDGGPCEVGVESTIVDLSAPRAAILRPGAIGPEAIELALGETLGPPAGTAAPGTLAAHYAPGGRVVMVEEAGPLAEVLRGEGRKVAVLFRRPSGRYAQALYAELRAADDAGADVIVAERAGDDDLGRAINDRLSRAAAGA